MTMNSIMDSMWLELEERFLRMIGMGLDALVDGGAPLDEEAYQAAIEEAGRQVTGLAPERPPAYPEALEAAIETVLGELERK